MNLTIVNNHFVKEPYITQTPQDSDVLSSSMKFFDKDGYELNHTEQLYYNYNLVNIKEKHLYHTANHVQWFIDNDNSSMGCVLDHSMISTRWAYRGAARAQIARLAEQRPELNKLLAIEPKWGIDISIDFVYEGGCFELFHIEADYASYEQALESKKKAEDLVYSTSWEEHAIEVLARKMEWQHLCSDDQADWKAKYFGWHRAFDNLKVFV